MKHTITNRIATLLLLAVGLAGCSKEETLPGTPDATRSPMSITVADSGYASTDKLHTRATDNGYATTFTEGDQIGLYIVKPDGNTYAAQNLCLTLTATGGGTLAWQAPTDTELNYEGATAKYFAYYPFQATLNGAPDPTATTAPAFFTNVISAWTPATYQSTSAAYTASDLMTGIGTVGNSKQPDGSYPLSFTMTHAMALVMIEVPSIKHTVEDGGTELSTYYSSNVDFLDFMPYSLAGIYRYLVKPSQSAATNLAGSYLATSGKFQEFTLQQNSINAASYAYYRVDGGGVIHQKHALQVGDFYLKDGSLVNKDALLSDDQKANCIGIVYWLGNIMDDNFGLLKKKFPQGTRGLVACNQLLTGSYSVNTDGNQQTMTWCFSESEFVTNFDWEGKPNDFKLPTNNKMQGYINTVSLQKYNITKGSSQFLYAKSVLPIDALASFKYPAPASSSGWYWPSDLELKTMCWGQGNNTQSLAGRNMLNTQFDKVGGQRFELLPSTQHQNNSLTYWASTEGWAYATQANVTDFSSGEIRVSIKISHEHPVRPILAF